MSKKPLGARPRSGAAQVGARELGATVRCELASRESSQLLDRRQRALSVPAQSRRAFLQRAASWGVGLSGYASLSGVASWGAGALLPASAWASVQKGEPLLSNKPELAVSWKVALLHLKPVLGDMHHNLSQLQLSLQVAAAQGARWAIAPELVLPGYHFAESLGTDWIQPAPDRWARQLLEQCRRLGLTLFLGHARRAQSGAMHNTILVLGREGRVLGHHDKINTIPVSESWSTPGSAALPVRVEGIDVGLLVCADAWPPSHSQALARAGARVLISSANWAPGEHGPGDVWERRSAETQLPLMVANRTGVDRTLDLRGAHSVVCYEGKRVVQHSSAEARVVLVEPSTSRWSYRAHPLP